MSLNSIISITIDASDDVGVSRVDLYIDGYYHQTNSVAPYTFSLNTATLTDGYHDLNAVAYDAAGNVGLSDTFVIEVDNSGGSGTNLQFSGQLRGTNLAGGEMTWGSYNIGPQIYATGIQFRGFNRAGAEYGCGWYGWDGGTFYTIPNTATLQAELNYLKAKGFNYIRFPIAWERIQHTLNGALNTIYRDLVKGFVDTCNGAGFRVMIDLHCYGQYAQNTHTSDQGTTQQGGYTQRAIGDGTLTFNHLADVWTKIATVFAAYPANMVDYDLMNEPHDLAMVSETFFAGINTVIVAIRTVDAIHRILVPNTRGSDMDHWNVYAPGDIVFGSGNGGALDDVAALAVVDSANNFSFSMHGYQDTTPEQWTTSVQAVTTWATTNNRKLFLNEFGINHQLSGDSTPSSPLTVTKNTVFTMTSESGVINYCFVPTAYDETHATPITLFVWLHGCGGYAQYDIYKAAQGTSDTWISMAVGGRENQCWSSYATDGSKILNAIAYIKTKLNINLQRVILGGYSSGGDIGYELMFKNSALFCGGIYENTEPSSAAVTASASATYKMPIVQLSHLSDTTYPIAGVRSKLAAITSNGFAVTAIEKAGTHYDADSGAYGTDYDLRTFAIPYINSGGWLAPSPSGSAILTTFLTYLNTHSDVWDGWAPWNLQSGTHNYNITSTSSYTTDGPSMAWYEANLTADATPGGQLYASGTNYLFCSNTDIDHIASKQMNFVRLIFSWEVMQNVLNGAISNNTYSTSFWNLINYITVTKNMYCMIEIHGGASTAFAKYKDVLVGTSPVTAAAFADLWTKLAGDTRMKNNAKTMIGLSNKPNFISGSNWWSAAQTASDAIRDAGFYNLVMIPGFGYDYASTWTTAGSYGGDTDVTPKSNAYYAALFTDKLATIDSTNYPTGNFCFQGNVFFDTDGGGAATNIVDATIGVTRAQPMLDWCIANNKRMFLGEFAAKASISGASTAVSNLLTYLGSNPTNCLGWAWWGYGPPTWWGTYQFTMCPTVSYTVDSPQYNLISAYLPIP